MDSQKLENMLNLSLNISESDREKSRVLGVGFEPEEQRWELIVKFNGDPEWFARQGIDAEILLAGYAIVTIPQSRIPFLIAAEEIEYVEMPKELIYNVYFAKQQSCFPLQITDALENGRDEDTDNGGNLTGKGCLVAVFDSGIDYSLPDFLTGDAASENVQSRIRYLWDQSLTPNPEEGMQPPEGFLIGVEFTQQQITEAVRTGGQEGFKIVPSSDVSGHGTAVTAIAAGSNPNRLYTGAAPGADLLIVKLGQPGNSSWPRTTQLMRAFAYALRKARKLRMPLAVNLSFGNSYGPHEHCN